MCGLWLATNDMDAGLGPLMAIYRVLFVDDREPEVIQADEVQEIEHHLIFRDALPAGFYGVRRRLLPHEWSRWSVVPDDTERL